MLTAHTSPLPPHAWGPGSVNQHASHVGGQTSQRSQFTCPVYIATYHPIKPVHSELLSVTVPEVIGTCTVLVGTVESVPVQSHCYNLVCKIYHTSLVSSAAKLSPPPPTFSRLQSVPYTQPPLLGTVARPRRYFSARPLMLMQTESPLGVPDPDTLIYQSGFLDNLTIFVKVFMYTNRSHNPWRAIFCHEDCESDSK